MFITISNSSLLLHWQSIPKDETELKFIMTVGSTFDDAFTRWGNALLKYNGKRTSNIFKKKNPKDVAREYLGNE